MEHLNKMGDYIKGDLIPHYSTVDMARMIINTVSEFAFKPSVFSESFIEHGLNERALALLIVETRLDAYKLVPFGVADWANENEQYWNEVKNEIMSYKFIDHENN